jgi:hypothetical protein
VKRMKRSQRSLDAEAAWLVQLASEGATDGGEPWAGVNQRRLYWCAKGHECRTAPKNPRHRLGMCRTCRGVDVKRARSAAAWSEFRDVVTIAAGTVLEPVWLGTNEPHRVLCPADHELLARPSTFRQFSALCPVCREVAQRQYPVTRKDGYVEVYRPGHPASRGNGWVLEHRWVLSEALGRPLAASESVHHRNGVCSDNRVENLQLKAGAHGRGLDIDDKVAHAVEILRLHRPEALSLAYAA